MLLRRYRKKADMAGLFHGSGESDAIVEQSGYRWILGVFLFMVKRGIMRCKSKDIAEIGK